MSELLILSLGFCVCFIVALGFFSFVIVKVLKHLKDLELQLKSKNAVDYEALKAVESKNTTTLGDELNKTETPMAEQIDFAQALTSGQIPNDVIL